MKAQRLAVLALVASLVVGSACGGSSEGNPALGQKTAALSDGPVSVMAHGHWTKDVFCYLGCTYEQYFWVDLRVRNDAYQKSVGVRWTPDQWASYQDATATFAETLADGYERWHVEVKVGTFRTGYNAVPRPEEIELAAFAQMNGVTSWDPGNNYYVFRPVSWELPVRLLSSAVDYEAGVGAVLTGRVRVFNAAYEKDVTVRYSVDGWATSQEVDATWEHGDEWIFRVEGLGVAQLPSEVQFAVHYVSGSVDAWDNNGGNNFAHTLQPTFSSNAVPGVLSGVYTFSIGPETDIAVVRKEIRMDDEEWVDGQQRTFSTANLEDGAHVLELRVTLNGGYQAIGQLPFTVANTLIPLSRWAPAYGGIDTNDAAWGLARDPEGRIYVRWEGMLAQAQEQYRGIVRFDSFGTTDGPFRYEALGTFPGETWRSDFWDFTLLDDGYAYALDHELGKSLFRFTPTGALDLTFGVGGRLDLSAGFGGHEHDVIMDIASGGGALWAVARCWDVSDTCHNGVYRFDRDGNYLGFAATDGDGAGYWDGSAYWMVDGGQLYRIEADAAGAPVLVETVALQGFTIPMPEDLVRTADGVFYVMAFSNVIRAFTAEGALGGSWDGGDVSGADYAGGIDLGKRLVALDDGSVAALDVEDGSLSRFSLVGQD